MEGGRSVLEPATLRVGVGLRAGVFKDFFMFYMTVIRRCRLWLPEGGLQ